MTSEQVKALVRNVPDFPIKGIQFKDITTILDNPEGLCWLRDETVKHYKGLGITKIVGIESRGFIIAPSVAMELGIGFVPIRKKNKLPAETVSVTYKKEYGEDTIQIHKDALNANDVVLIHDDILATGGSMEAAIELKSAAQDQKMANFKTADDFRTDIIRRQEAEGRQKEVQNALGLFNTAEGNEGKRFAINRAQELVDDRQSAYEEARKRYYDLGMNSDLTGNNEEDQKILAAIAAAKEEMDIAAAAFQEVSPLIAAITQAEQQIEQSIVGEINETKKRLDEQEARRQKMEDAARLAAEEDENERLAKRLEYGMVATTPEEAEAIDEQIAALEEEQKKKDNPLKGAFTASTIRQTDSLTRIGGGTGYASYNNSTAQIQKNIETSLKTLISNQKNQNDQIIQKLDEFKNIDFTTTWE